jgi:hypothetical protein
MEHQQFGTVTPANPVVASGPSRWCAGGEVRVESSRRIQLAENGWVLVTLTLELYEGASCYSNDLDGRRTTSFWIAPGATAKTALTVRNDDEGGDYATYNYVLKNADWTLS